MKVKKIVYSLLCTFCVLLSVPVMTAGAVDAYTAEEVSVDFSFTNADGKNRDCTAVISYEEGMPSPDQNSKTVRNGKTGSFSMSFVKPGIYTYTISQTAGSDENVIYDDTIFTVTIYITNAEEDGQLDHTVTLNSSKSGAKPSEVLFYNTSANGSTTATSTVTTVPASHDDSPKTGDSSNADLCLLIAAISGITALLSRGRKDVTTK